MFFEGLLLKIKNDIIKFLLNLNLVISDTKQKEEQKMQVASNKKKKLVEMKNALCGSEKKSNFITLQPRIKIF